MPRSSRLHHIHRIDSTKKHTHCWRVQIQRHQRIVMRHFSDAQYGDKGKALKAAIAFREAALRKLPDQTRPQWWRTTKRRNNTSGIVGVGRYVTWEERKQGPLERVSWQAFWDDADGKRRGRKFSVKKYGEQQAKVLAHRARQDAMRTILKK